MVSFPLSPASAARHLLLARMRVGGGKGSGNFGHAGRPGQVGGSADDSSKDPSTKGISADQKDWTADYFKERLVPVTPTQVFLYPQNRHFLFPDGTYYSHPTADTHEDALGEDFNDIMHTVGIVRVGSSNAFQFFARSTESQAQAIVDMQTLSQSSTLFVDIVKPNSGAVLGAHVFEERVTADGIRNWVNRHFDENRVLSLRSKLEAFVARMAGGPGSGKLPEYWLTILGGPGSGNFGHAGRPGEVGGSSSDSSVEVAVTALFDTPGMMVHGSNKTFSSMRPGSMFSNDPTWAAGYTTKLGMGDDETFVGKIHAFTLPDGKVLESRSVHNAEDLLIKKAKELSGKDPATLYDAALIVAAETEAVAIVSRDRFGKINGGILIREASVIGHTDPVKALVEAQNRGLNIPSNLERALKKIRIGGGSGSGNFGHIGRPGAVGGSLALAPHPAAPLAAGGYRATPLRLGGAASDRPAWTDQKAEVEAQLLAAGTLHDQAAAAPEEEVDVDSLVTYQTWVHPRSVSHHLVDPPRISGIVFQHAGHDWIIDGNNRIAARKLAGETKVRVLRVGGKKTEVKAAEEGTAYEFSKLPEYWLTILTHKHPIVSAADAHVAKLEVLVRYAFAMGRKELPNIEAALEASEQVLQKLLPKALVKVVNAGAEATDTLKTAEAFRAAKPKLTPRTVAARDWAEEHAADLIKGIGQTTRDRVNVVVAQYADRLSEMLPALKKALGDEDRARVIARTESMRAAHKGQQLVWQEAQDEGLLSSKAKRTWIVTDDDKLCPICEPLDGKTASLDDAYDAGSEYLDGPPAHPNCRCTEGLA